MGSYRETQRQKAVAIRDQLFQDPGNGMFLGKDREFVLSEPALNLWEGIREDALAYFKENKILWWHGANEEPTGHLLSSQVACVNHLYGLRQRKDLATAVLKGIRSDIQEAVLFDDSRAIGAGYVEFEFIGKKPYLNEKAWTRGANCTSVDAVMIGKDERNRQILFLIEWKYTEEYPVGSKYVEARSAVYDELITDPGSPFREVTPEWLYYEPFYQLMRQTLLGWKAVENRDHDCEDYMHLHVIPKENVELYSTITSPGLKGKDICEAWKGVLKNPEKYQTLSPPDLLKPCRKEADTRSLLSYLAKRYWG